METKEGNMIVNEFESMEAMYDSTKPDETHHTQAFLAQHWSNICVRVFKTCASIA